MNRDGTIDTIDTTEALAATWVMEAERQTGIKLPVEDGVLKRRFSLVMVAARLAAADLAASNTTIDELERNIQAMAKLLESRRQLIEDLETKR